ncbi:MAG TPA: ParA family protein [Paracoccaceae bacterium]|nr:ParA family protein [Paracoccaceae bacterium]
MRTILVANRKGGCGKTVTAITLAAALAGRSGRVGLADADRQKSALRWLRARPAGAAPIEAVDWTKDGFGAHPKRLEYLVVDAPGALKGSRAEALVAEADAMVTPVLPSIFDEESTRRFLRDVEELKRVRKGKVELDLIANRVRAHARCVAELTAFFERIGQVPVAWIAERTAYPDLAAEGLTVFDRRGRSFHGLQEQWRPLIDRLMAA